MGELGNISEFRRQDDCGYGSNASDQSVVCSLHVVPPLLANRKPRKGTRVESNQYNAVEKHSLTSKTLEFPLMGSTAFLLLGFTATTSLTVLGVYFTGCFSVIKFKPAISCLCRCTFDHMLVAAYQQ